MKRDKQKRFMVQRRRRVGRYLFFLVGLISVFAISQNTGAVVLETSSSVTGNYFRVQMGLIVPPEELISGVQIECNYDSSNWALVEVIPGEGVILSDKALQYSDINGQVRVLIIGLNNTAIPSSPICELIFNSLSDPVSNLKFYISQAKFVSPDARSVIGSIEENNGIEEGTHEESVEESGNSGSSTLNSNPTEKAIPEEATQTSDGVKPETQNTKSVGSSSVCGYTENVSGSVNGDRRSTEIKTKPSSSEKGTPTNQLYSSYSFGNNTGQEVFKDSQESRINFKDERLPSITVNSKQVLPTGTNILRERMRDSYQQVMLDNNDAGTGLLDNVNTKIANVKHGEVANTNMMNNMTPEYKDSGDNNFDWETHNNRNTINSTFLAMNTFPILEMKGRKEKCITIERTHSISDTGGFGNPLFIISLVIVGTVFLLIGLTTLIRYIPIPKDSIQSHKM